MGCSLVARHVASAHSAVSWDGLASFSPLWPRWERSSNSPVNTHTSLPYLRALKGSFSYPIMFSYPITTTYLDYYSSLIYPISWLMLFVPFQCAGAITIVVDKRELRLNECATWHEIRNVTFLPACVVMPSARIHSFSIGEDLQDQHNTASTHPTDASRPTHDCQKRDAS